MGTEIWQALKICFGVLRIYQNAWFTILPFSKKFLVVKILIYILRLFIFSTNLKSMVPLDSFFQHRCLIFVVPLKTQTFPVIVLTLGQGFELRIFMQSPNRFSCFSNFKKAFCWLVPSFRRPFQMSAGFTNFWENDFFLCIFTVLENVTILMEWNSAH